MRNWILISMVLTCLTMSFDTVACGNSNKDTKKEKASNKSCCSSENSGQEKNCCCSDSDSQKKDSKECDGSCKHKGCNSSTISSFYLNSEEFVPITPIIFIEEVQNLWSYSQSKISPVYLAIWQPPKI
jgi:hypothetical protein